LGWIFFIFFADFFSMMRSPGSENVRLMQQYSDFDFVDFMFNILCDQRKWLLISMVISDSQQLETPEQIRSEIMTMESALQVPMERSALNLSHTTNRKDVLRGIGLLIQTMKMGFPEGWQEISREFSLTNLSQSSAEHISKKYNDFYLPLQINISDFRKLLCYWIDCDPLVLANGNYFCNNFVHFHHPVTVWNTTYNINHFTIGQFITMNHILLSLPKVHTIYPLTFKSLLVYIIYNLNDTQILLRTKLDSMLETTVPKFDLWRKWVDERIKPFHPHQHLFRESALSDIVPYWCDSLNCAPFQHDWRKIGKEVIFFETTFTTLLGLGPRCGSKHIFDSIKVHWPDTKLTEHVVHSFALSLTFLPEWREIAIHADQLLHDNVPCCIDKVVVEYDIAKRIDVLGVPCNSPEANELVRYWITLYKLPSADAETDGHQEVAPSSILAIWPMKGQALKLGYYIEYHMRLHVQRLMMNEMIFNTRASYCAMLDLVQEDWYLIIKERLQSMNVDNKLKNWKSWVKNFFKRNPDLIQINKIPGVLKKKHILLDIITTTTAAAVQVHDLSDTAAADPEGADSPQTSGDEQQAKRICL
jgi:hypothetical protein